MRRLPLIIAAVALLCVACGSDDTFSRVPSLPQGEFVPTMSTLDVNTFVSDSGYTKLHITSDVWRMYEDAPDPFWKFPEGLYLEKFDTSGRIDATVVCDSAIYYSRQRIWRLDGNVVMRNEARDSFISQQMFWDQNKQMVYSDSFIHIVRFDRIIEGYGFESNQSLTAYTVHRPTGIIPVNRPEPRLAETRQSADSAATERPNGRRMAPIRASEAGL